MTNLKLALGHARQLRRCPPPQIKMDAAHKENMKEHIRICPFCAVGQTADDSEVLASLSGRLGMDDYMHAAWGSDSEIFPDTRILPGDLRLIHPGESRWRDGYYYNPPMVLILEHWMESPGVLLAAQTYHDTCLAGVGDLILSAEQTGGMGLFIETWNVYNLRQEMLGPPAGRVSDSILQAVRHLESNPRNQPPWAVHPLPMLENDPRDYFRQMEVEVGYTFAISAADEIMKMFEARPEEFFNRPPDSVVSEIQRLDPTITWHRAPASAGSAFLTLQFSPDQIQMAAADTEEALCVANLIKLEQERVVSVSPIYAQIKTETKNRHFRAISGMMKGDAVLAATGLLAGWQASGGRIYLPDRIEWEPGHYFFYLEFTHLPDASGQLRMAIIESA